MTCSRRNSREPHDYNRFFETCRKLFAQGCDLTNSTVIKRRPPIPGRPEWRSLPRTIWSCSEKSWLISNFFCDDRAIPYVYIERIMRTKLQSIRQSTQ